MSLRIRRSLFAVLTLAVALGAMPSAEALYSAHDRVVSADPADFTPHVVDGKVTAILPVGDRIYVGGTFTQIKQTKDLAAPIILKAGLFAFNATTGAIDMTFEPPAWGIDPTPSVAKGVEALAPGPDGTIFVGGTYAYNTRKILKLNGATGAVVNDFDVSTGGNAVKDLVVDGDRLFLAGIFSSVQSQTRRGLAVVDVETGGLDPEVAIDFTEPRQVTDPLVPKPRVESIALSPDGKTLVAGGNFTKAAGQDRFQIALLDVTEGRAASLLNWQTSRYDDRREGDSSTWPTDDDTGEPDPFRCAEAFDTHIRDTDFSPDGKYFVVVTTGGFSRGTMCDTATRWESSARGSDLQPTWVDYDGGDSFTGVAVTGSVIYVSGHMRAMNNNYTDGSAADALPGPGHVAREGIVALDPASGLPLPWNPGRERGEGGWALASSPDGLWVGSDTDRIGGETHQKLAFFPKAGGATVPTWTAQGMPGDLYRLGTDKSISRRVFDGNVVGPVTTLPSSIDWSQMRGAFALPGVLYTGRSDGKLLRWSFNGSQLGQPQEVSLRGMEVDLDDYFPITRMTGMAYDSGRVYFTLSGDKTLYYRYFLPESNVADDIVGAEILKASGPDIDGKDWSKVTGMTMANGKIYWAENGAELYQMSFSNGRPTGAKTVAIANAGVAGRGLFLLPATSTPPPVSIDPPAPPAPPAPPGGGSQTPGGRSGYWMVGNDGAVYAFGESRHLGNAPVGSALAVDLEPTPSSNGYWIVDDQGHVFGFGDAPHHGNADTAKMVAGEKVTSISATPSGNGYWLFTTKGRVMAKGDAVHFGDVSAIKLNGPVLDSIPTPSGRGYYMVASDGGIFTFGDAVFHGSTGSIKLNAPVQSLVPNPLDGGYWLVASDGGVFTFGNVPFRGSMGSTKLNKPMTGMVPYGNGYLMVAEDGGIFNFSDKAFLGSLGSTPPARPVVSVASIND